MPRLGKGLPPAEHLVDAAYVDAAAAINVERLAAWLRATPRAATRTSRFAALAA